MASRRQWALAGSVLAAVVTLIVAGVALTSNVRLVSPGSPAPDVAAVNVRTGESVTLADYAGTVILLNIWATWCAPCEAEMPSLQRLHEVLGPGGLKIVAVSIDHSDPEDILRWVTERGLTFEVLQDRERRIERSFQTTGVPETFIIDPEGVIVRREIGAREWDASGEVARLQRILRDTAAAPDQGIAGATTPRSN
jgi:cytochrome c biogenesis protein CcmG/thiol:disulfide interchange protein DsbE